MRPQTEPGKLDIKRREPGILSISLQVDSLFKLAIMTSLSSFKSIQCHRRLDWFSPFNSLSAY